MLDIKEYSIEVNGKPLIAQFTDLADQAHGSVIMRYGNTALLVTAVMSEEKKEGTNWFPLTVDYEERFYAAGEILGSRFIRREGKPTDEAVLSARVVDRTIRPLFNQKIRNEVQVVITILSISEDDPDIPAIVGTSLALATSNIPWNGPVSAVRIGQKEVGGELIINPIYENRLEHSFDMIACGKDGNINMIEVGGNQVSEDFVTEALRLASEKIEKIQEWQKKIIGDIGKEKRNIEIDEIKPEVVELFEKEIAPKIESAIFTNTPGKKSIDALHKDWLKIAKEKFPEENVSLASDYYEEKVDELIHEGAIKDSKRPDGRKMDEIRPIFAKVGSITPIVHGSGQFYRGGTHILSVLTLGGPDSAQLIEGMEEKLNKRFFHHYNFPPFSTGETGRVGGFNRRMIGHGALAEKAIQYILPNQEEFPYTLRIVSEAMASNGSTSMGSVCGSTLALMDGGVPIKAPVAGIASGLMMDKEGNYKVLTDIQGPEDHHGDMDFKVAGTKDGITAIQMDVKVGGIPIPVLKEALEKARGARLQILDVMLKEIPTPRESISPNAPEVLMTKIKKDQIGLVIGGGGKTINEIKERTGAEITIEDDGSVFVTGKNGAAKAALEIIKNMTRVFKAGEQLEGEVVNIAEFGAFVKLNEHTDGLVHISEIAPFRVNKVEDYIKVGDVVPVVIKEVDERGRIALSIKAMNPELFEEKKS